jgi:hypothetical protein
MKQKNQNKNTKVKVKSTKCVKLNWLLTNVLNFAISICLKLRKKLKI